MYFKATYSNGYCGCDITEYFKADSEEEVASYMEEGLYDYAEDYAHAHFGWDNHDYTEDEFDDYYQDCSYNVVEITDMDDLEGEEIIDLTM